MLDRIIKQQSTIYKYDKMWLGFLLGLVGPVMGVLLFYFAEMDQMTFARYISSLKEKIILSPLLSLGCIVDGFIFFLFLRKDYYNVARGVILAMFLWALPIIGAKFF